MQIHELKPLIGKPVLVEVERKKMTRGAVHQLEVVSGLFKGYRLDMGDDELCLLVVGYSRDIVCNFISDKWNVSLLEGSVWG
jgi:hypothetical protein